jgi:GNAT superfamily N-acetyltransferase
LPFALHGGMASLSNQGWDWVINRGISDYRIGATTDTLTALAITVSPNYRGKGYGGAAIMAMQQIAAAQSLNHVVAPIRS